MMELDNLLDLTVGLGVLAFLIAGMVLRSKRPKTPLWSLMAFMAFVVVMAGLVPLETIAKAIDMDVVLFLIGMFSIVAVAESSGLLDWMAHFVVSRFKHTHSVLVFLSLTMGFLSAIAVNDTVALMGPPIVYSLARSMDIDPRPAFLLLAFSITIGSTTYAHRQSTEHADSNRLRNAYPLHRLRKVPDRTNDNQSSGHCFDSDKALRHKERGPSANEREEVHKQY
jgi:di/tricarboxylate transporter